MLLLPHLLRKRSGFTLVELLVVIAIIAILVGVTLAGVSAALNSARRAQASTDLNKIVTGTTAYYTDYGSYPLTANYQGGDVTYGENAPLTANLMDVLRADYQAWDSLGGGNLNPKQIIYLQWKYVNQATPPGAIGNDGQPRDPWGRVYIIRVDSNYDGTVANPYSANAGPNPLPNGVIGWSFGRDKDGGQGDKSVAPAKDDIISW